jgi:hypothetical protein
MTTGATTLLSLALPVEGELDGTWGDVVNYGITDYVDIAVAGTLTFTGDGAITLANTVGTSTGTNISSTTAQYAIIKITGTLTATKVITAPSYSKTYIVDNTTATFGVTFKASGQTGVTVAAGEKCTVYYNGTDYVKVASSVADGVTSVSGTGTVNGITLTGTVTSTGSLTLGGALTGVNLASQVTGTLPIANGGTGTTSTTFANLTTNVTGTLPIANGGTGTTSTTFVNLATNVTGTLPVANGGTGITSLGTGVATFLGTPTSANLAAAVTDETGSGSLVFATSPTLVTPVLGTPTSGNFSTGTFTWPTFNQNTTGTAAGLSATLAVASGGTGVTTSTGTGSTVLSASPTFTGAPLAPTATTGTNTTQLATTAFVQNQIGAIAAGVSSFSAGTTGLTPATSQSGAITLAGTLAVANGGTGVTTSTGTGSTVLSASPALTGIPTVPTAGNGTNTTQAASTAFVINQIGAIAAGVSSFSAGTTGLTPTLATSGAITLAGTLAVANGGTGVTTSTGSGNNVLSTSPTLVTPLLGTPTSGNLANCTFPTLNQNTTGTAAGLSATLAVASGGTGVTTSTGTGSVVLSTSPTLVTPLLGTPTSGNLANCTFPTLNQNTSGTAAGLSSILAVASGGTGTATPALVQGTGVTITGSWPNQTIAASSAAGQYQAVASGTLANGSKIIVNLDGTVSAVIADSQSGGSATAFSGGSTITNSTDPISIGYDSTNNRVVVAYVTETGTRGRAAVGTVSGTSISFGTAVEFESTGVTSPSVAFDPNTGKVVIAYNVGSTGKAIVGTVSGTSISYGTAVTFDASPVAYVRAVYDSSSTKVVIAYQNTSTNYGWAIVGTVSGTSISFGTAVNFNAANSFYVSAAATGTKIVVSYRNGGNSNYGTSIVGTVSGTSISFGTAAVFHAVVADYIMSTYDSTNAKVVIGYVNTSSGDYGTAVVGTVSGTSISFGTPVVFNAATTFSSIAISYSVFANRVVIACWNSGSGNNGAMLTGTVSGTSISFSASATYNSVTTFRPVLTYDSTAQKLVVAYQFNAANGVGNAQVLTVGFTNLTATNYIGISDAAYANGATATIQTVGSVDDAQTSLTPGLAYYVQTDGTLATTAGSPSVFAGTAVAATKILVKG